MSFGGAGIQQRDPVSGRVLRTITAGPAQGLGVGDNQALGFDADGVPWVAGGDGMLRWNPATGRFAPVEGISTDGRIFAFRFDGPDALWLQRLAGLEHYRVGGRR